MTLSERLRQAEAKRQEQARKQDASPPALRMAYGKWQRGSYLAGQ